jgi:hypothetical protein
MASSKKMAGGAGEVVTEVVLGQAEEARSHDHQTDFEIAANRTKVRLTNRMK